MRKLICLLLLGLLSGCMPNFLNPPGVRVYIEAFPSVPLASDAELTVQILDSSGSVVSGRTQKSPGQFPVNLFFVPYDPAKLAPGGRYVVSASIQTPGGLRLLSQNPTPVGLGGGVEYIKLEVNRLSAPVMATLSASISLPSQTILPANAKLRVRLFESGNATVAEKSLTPDDLFFSRFNLEYDSTLLSPNGSYVLAATLEAAGKVVFQASQPVNLPEAFGVRLELRAVTN